MDIARRLLRSGRRAILTLWWHEPGVNLRWCPERPRETGWLSVTSRLLLGCAIWHSPSAILTASTSSTHGAVCTAHLLLLLLIGLLLVCCLLLSHLLLLCHLLLHHLLLGHLLLRHLLLSQLLLVLLRYLLLVCHGSLLLLSLVDRVLHRLAAHALLHLLLLTFSGFDSGDQPRTRGGLSLMSHHGGALRPLPLMPGHADQWRSRQTSNLLLLASAEMSGGISRAGKVESRVRAA